jgi:hypothetical protein
MHVPGSASWTLQESYNFTLSAMDFAMVAGTTIILRQSRATSWIWQGTSSNMHRHELSSWSAIRVFLQRRKWLQNSGCWRNALVQIDLTTALGRLLSDVALRSAYLRDRAGTARTMEIRECDIAQFLSLSGDELERQALALVQKRFHEVARLLPRTFNQLGKKAEHLFHEYSTAYWPRGHHRHFEDAVQFRDFLRTNGHRGLNQAEYNEICAILNCRWLSIHVVRDLWVDGDKHYAVQIFFRDRKRVIRSLALFISGFKGARKSAFYPTQG